MKTVNENLYILIMAICGVVAIYGLPAIKPNFPLNVAAIVGMSVGAVICVIHLGYKLFGKK